MPDAEGYDWQDDAKKAYRLWCDWNHAKIHPTLCQCGKPLKTEDRGHHVVTLCCGRPIEGCCGDV